MADIIKWDDSEGGKTFSEVTVNSHQTGNDWFESEQKSKAVIQLESEVPFAITDRTVTCKSPQTCLVLMPLSQRSWSDSKKIAGLLPCPCLLIAALAFCYSFSNSLPRSALCCQSWITGTKHDKCQYTRLIWIHIFFKASVYFFHLQFSV